MVLVRISLLKSEKKIFFFEKVEVKEFISKNSWRTKLTHFLVRVSLPKSEKVKSRNLAVKNHGGLS